MIKYQFNKTSLQLLEKQLKVRVRALPTLKSKESALRLEVKKAKFDIASMDEQLEAQIAKYENMEQLWGEFDTSLLHVDDVRMSIKKIAGVETPILEGVDFSVKPFSLFNSPQWFLEGMELVKQLAEIGIEREFYEQKMVLLEYSRKKTTQKVNLFEKVQIPGYQEAVLKIKRFMEDEENLSKSSQKIMRSQQEKKKEAML